MAKKFARGVVIALCCLFVFYAAAVYLIDPYLHYHEPWFGLKAQRTDDSRYENYGLARFMDYDAVMLGTSVTQDAKASEFNALFDCNALRVKFSGSYFKELGDFLKYAFEVHEGIDQVFMVLDITHLLTTVDTLGHTDNPEYLYDSDLRNDASYLLNKDVLPDLIRSVANMSPIDFDWQVWNDPTGWDTLVQVYGPNRPEQQEEKTFDAAVTMLNYETNVISIAREHPETTFYFVFPCGNAFFWDYVSRYGEFDCYMQAMEAVMTEMLTLDNVHIHNFVDDADKTQDLNRYKDRVHFDPDIMSDIIADVAAGTHEITKENISERMAEIRAYWTNVNYEALYENGGQGVFQ